MYPEIAARSNSYKYSFFFKFAVAFMSKIQCSFYYDVLKWKN